MITNSFPRLVADIGGTNARFSLEVSPYKYEHIKVLACKDYKDLVEAANAYLLSIGINHVEYVGLALPTPIVGDSIYMVNNPWQTMSISETKKELGLKNIVFLNDFHALALSIPHIPTDYLTKIGGIDTEENRPRGVIGPGTGLGVATLIKHPNGDYLAVPAEGGHTTFAPANLEEMELWQFVHRRFSHVSFERFVSGPGLQLIYEAVCHQKHYKFDQLPTPAEITNRAINRECWISQLTLDHFCRMLGTVSSNLAITTNSFGGVYIGGGVVPKIIEYFNQSDFRCRFEDKGRLRKYLEKIPVYVITHEFPAFLGVSYALDTLINKGYLP
ncbi:MAG: glucokinase [Burkholderiales bacterium]|nr:glucokinase [Burkholderiales bacterium]